MRPKTMTSLPSQCSTSLVPCHSRTPCFHFYIFPAVLMYEIMKVSSTQGFTSAGTLRADAWPSDPRDVFVHEPTTAIVSWETSPLSFFVEFNSLRHSLAILPGTSCSFFSFSGLQALELVLGLEATCIWPWYHQRSSNMRAEEWFVVCSCLLKFAEMYLNYVSETFHCKIHLHR